MLSILIPTYNYSAANLIEELSKQCLGCKIIFEIIVLDDNSTFFLNENSTINKLENCRFLRNEINLGRAANRNKLIALANFEWILFMDSDTFPTEKNFIQKYKNTINSNYKVCFGGIAYHQELPDYYEILRWKYGCNREAVLASKRIKNPYKFVLTSNILIHKSIFGVVKFNEKITNYGYEDLVFIQQLEVHKIGIHHIENSAFHLNYETSKKFLKKTKKALQNLKYLEANNIIIENSIRILKLNSLLEKFRLKAVIIYLFKKLKVTLIKNLLSRKPSLLIFDFYKLGYYCSIK